MNMYVLKRIIKYVRPHARYIAATVLFAAAGVALTLYTPILIGQAVDMIVGPANVDFTAMVPILAKLAAMIGLAAVCTWIMSLCANKAAYYTARDMRKELFYILNSVPLAYIDKTPHGDIISRVINDIDAVSDGLLQGANQIFTGCATILGTLAFMLSVNVPITLVVVVLTPLSMFVASFIGKRVSKFFKETAQIQGELGGYVEEMVGGARVVKAFEYGGRAFAHFSEINKRLYNSGVKAQFFSALTNPCTRFVNGVVYAAVGVIGAISAINGGLTVGEISCFLAYANQYTKPFNEITGVITQFQSAIASAQRVFTVIDQQTEPQDDKASVQLDKLAGGAEVTMENVRFAYEVSRPLIENLNLNVKTGSRVAIVGPTGCGKTTIINLLMRFYDVDSGAIKLRGVDIRGAARASVRGMYGMVLQDTWLFSGTVRENIMYGKPDASEDEMLSAAKEAHAHTFITRMPNGYDTQIGESGGDISEGQKQLLCIARVMLRKPPMLILDEATSNIDTLTEVYVQKAFSRMMEGHTSFVVAHRLSTIREADVILVMRAGQVVEQGTHDELLQRRGFYAELYNSQFAVSE